MTVYENLEFYVRLKGVKRDYITQILNSVIYDMKLNEFKKKLAKNLSGGNKRKLTLAISMLCKPPIILLDEPSKGMDPESKRLIWNIFHKLSMTARKPSIILTTHSMDEAETLCKRIGVMYNGEFICLDEAYGIKNRYGYGYKLNIRIKPLSEELENKLFFNKYNIDKNLKVNMDNIRVILKRINKINYLNEINEGRLGEKLMRYMKKSNRINISSLLSWIFYVNNAIKFINYGKDNFDEIIIEENMENSFLFKMKKKKDNNKSIGYFFAVFEKYKEECYVSEYSLKQSSLEEIFNKFSENKSFQLKKRINTETQVYSFDKNTTEGEIVRNKIFNKKIILTDDLSNKLLNDE
jgi:ATP-binding cassette subfamily A (ABC1) protein 3